MRRRRPDHVIPTDDRTAVLLALARRGWSVESLAHAVGGDAAQLRRWLQGDESISQAMREAIAVLLANEESG